MERCFSAGGVRKGAWTREEDILLKQCVEKYGQGKWRLVPDRAGLNRYRKSFRLRWMNYLKPDIKRGAFAGDEVDLILRLHKLLGNRQVLYILLCISQNCMTLVLFFSFHIMYFEFEFNQRLKIHKL